MRVILTIQTFFKDNNNIVHGILHPQEGRGNFIGLSGTLSFHLPLGEMGGGLSQIRGLKFRTLVRGTKDKVC